MICSSLSIKISTISVTSLDMNRPLGAVCCLNEPTGVGEATLGRDEGDVRTGGELEEKRGKGWHDDLHLAIFALRLTEPH